MTNEDLKKIVKKWQPRLGLSDWTIKIRFSDMRAIDGLAQTTIQNNMQNADIQILQPGDRQASDMADHDIEQDVVHELVHVRLWMQDKVLAERNIDIEYTLREQSVDWLAKAMLIAERSNKGGNNGKI
mgnify:FL=1|jgi:hypothetical protein